MKAAITIILAVVITGVMFVGVTWGMFAIMNRLEQDAVTETPNGFVLTKRAFVDSCMTTAYVPDSGVSWQEANTYCGCVYDSGMIVYGEKAWMDELTNIGNTNTISPKTNEIMNGCISESV